MFEYLRLQHQSLLIISELEHVFFIIITHAAIPVSVLTCQGLKLCYFSSIYEFLCSWNEMEHYDTLCTKISLLIVRLSHFSQSC